MPYILAELVKSIAAIAALLKTTPPKAGAVVCAELLYKVAIKYIPGVAAYVELKATFWYVFAVAVHKLALLVLEATSVSVPPE